MIWKTKKTSVTFDELHEAQGEVLPVGSVRTWGKAKRKVKKASSGQWVPVAEPGASRADTLKAPEKPGKSSELPTKAGPGKDIPTKASGAPTKPGTPVTRRPGESGEPGVTHGIVGGSATIQDIEPPDMLSGPESFQEKSKGLAKLLSDHPLEVERFIGGGLTGAYVGRAGKKKLIVKTGKVSKESFADEHGRLDARATEKAEFASIDPKQALYTHSAVHRLAEAMGGGHLVKTASVGKSPTSVSGIEEGQPLFISEHAGDEFTDASEDPESWGKVSQEDRVRAAVLDFLSVNTDRHHGNLMVSKDGKLTLIDHNYTFTHEKNSYRLERSVFYPGGDLQFDHEKYKTFDDLPDEVKKTVEDIAGSTAEEVQKKYGLNPQDAEEMSTRARSLKARGLMHAIGSHGGAAIYISQDGDKLKHMHHPVPQREVDVHKLKAVEAKKYYGRRAKGRTGTPSPSEVAPTARAAAPPGGTRK